MFLKNNCPFARELRIIIACLVACTKATTYYSIYIHTLYLHCVGCEHVYHRQDWPS